MKAKHMLETIRCLQRDDGTMVDDEDGIMEELSKAYVDIYALDS